MQVTLTCTKCGKEVWVKPPEEAIEALIKRTITSGVSGSSTPGPAGPQGPAGPAGAPSTVPGPAGPAGPQGPASTIPGPKGDKGDPGDASTVPGPQGNQGIQGAPGYTPVKGVDYFDGAAGSQGPQGPQGNQGPQGQAGAGEAENFATLAAGTTAMALGTNTTVKVTPNAGATFTTTVPAAGKRRTIIILTSGTTSYTITFGTGFKASGTLATGTTSARVFVMDFISDGINLYECRPRTAMVA
jgi:hypothetical protein